MSNTFETNPGCQFRIVHLALVIALIGIVLAVTVPRIRDARDQALRSSCTSRPKQISLALQNYHDEYGCLPPAHYADSTGRPMHSWRVLIWPFYDANPAYNQYRFDEPWNGPNNRRLHQLQNYFDCPADNTSDTFNTNYVAVTGSRLWPKSGTYSLDSPGRPASRTIMIVEISDSDIHWMEPRDLPLDELDKWLDPNSKPRLFGNHINGGWVAFPDGHIEFLTRDEVIKRLKALAIESNLEPAASNIQP